MERTSRATIVFRRPFALPDVDGQLPAGSYDVETIEEPIDGLSFIAYRRVSTVILVRDPASGARQVVSIDPEALATALRQDAVTPAVLG